MTENTASDDRERDSPGTEHTPFERASLDALPESTHEEVFETSPPRVVRLRLDAGDRVPAHSHPEKAVVFHLLDGSVELTVDGETASLSPGDLVRFPGEREVSPEAEEDSVALVVLSPRA